MLANTKTGKTTDIKPLAAAPAIEQRSSFRVFFGLLVLSVCATGVTSSALLNPATQALWFWTFTLLALPFYLYFLMENRDLRAGIKQPLTYAVGAFLCASLLAGIFGPNPVRSFWGSYTRMTGNYQLLHLTLLYFYLLLLAKASRRYFYILLRVLVWIASLSCLYTIEATFGVHSLIEDYSLRIYNIYGNPIFFASFLILPMALALFFCCHAKTTALRALYLTLFVLQVTGVLMSGTRGAMMGVAGGIFLAGILYAFNSGKRWHRYAAGSLLAAAVLGVFAIVAVATWFPQVDSGHRLVRLNDKDGKYRLSLWRIAWQSSLERPVFGIGPENFDVVYHQHFQPALFQFDADPQSAFSTLIWDKPHNNLLEILATTGAAGLLSYAAILVFTLYAFIRGYRAGCISWAQLVILICGSVAYQLQNLFAFDTPSASLAFFVYTALAGVLWAQSEPAVEKRELSRQAVPPLLSRAIVGAAAIAGILGVFVTAATASTIRDIRSGTSMSRVNPHLAKDSFDHAAQSSFIYDRSDLAREYLGFAIRLAAQRNLDPSFVNAAFDDAINVTERAVRQVQNDAVLWISLADLYLVQATLHDTPPGPPAEIAIRRAIALAPNRLEPQEYLARYDLDHQPSDSAAILDRILKNAPQRGAALWIQALLYNRRQQPDLAAQTGLEALRNGYHTDLTKELDWLIAYYSAKQDYPRLIELYKKAIALDSLDSKWWSNLAKTYASSGDPANAQSAWNNWMVRDYTERHEYRQLAALYEKALSSNPDNPQLFGSLARVYADMGDKPRARLAAMRAAELDPHLELQMKVFLRSLE